MRSRVGAVFVVAAARATALDLDALKEHGWPGEQLLRQALANRVHVTLASMRADGLKSVLLRSDQGYLLDPNLPILRVATFRGS